MCGARRRGFRWLAVGIHGHCDESGAVAPHGGQRCSSMIRSTVALVRLRGAMSAPRSNCRFASHVVFSIAPAYLAAQRVPGTLVRWPSYGEYLALAEATSRARMGVRSFGTHKEVFANEHQSRREKAVTAQSTTARADAAISQAAPGKAGYRIEAQAASAFRGRGISGRGEIKWQGRADHRRRFGYWTRSRGARRSRGRRHGDR